MRKNIFGIIGSNNYELHQILKKNSYDWKVWSIKNGIYLKDTTSWGKSTDTNNHLVGIVFNDGKREKMYIRDIVKNLRGVVKL
ncbi:hypothetical protein [Cetobacterium sp.]|uniref:hypothetical protein n=1 Tax=Cetobacterium sp. TaxID=2071632 RepID=UPI003F3FC1B9